MTAQGYDEILGSGMAEPGLLSKVSAGSPQVRIVNPIAEDLSVMQNAVLYSLLKAVGNNFAQRNLDLRLFEIGKAYLPCEDTAPSEIEQI